MTDTATSWFFETVEDTALRTEPGQVALVERRARAGVMPPLHRRQEDESFRVLEGAVTFFVGGEEVPAGPGDVVVAPGGTARTYRVESPEARWLVLTRVHSLVRYEDFGRAVADPADGSRPAPEELAALLAIAAENGIELLGSPGAVPERV